MTSASRSGSGAATDERLWGIEATGETRIRTLGHVPALDGLRGIAVMLVVLLHASLLMPRYRGYTHAVKGGWLGVDIFFVLSGFLITALLLGEYHRARRVRFGAFYVRRALRLLPALWVLLAVQVVYNLAVPGRGSERKTVTWALLYIANWQATWDLFSVNSQLGHLWSLAIEEQFYLVWPWLLVGLVALKRPRVAAAIIATGIAITVVHRIDLANHSAFWRLLARTDTRADSLLIGCLLAWAWTYGLIRRRMAIAAWIAVLALVACVWRGEPTQAFWYYGGFTLFAALVAVVILASVEGEWSGTRLLSLRPLVEIGRVSYGLYLWHLPIFWAVARQNGWAPLTRAAVGVALTAAATVISWKLVERPAQRLRRRFESVPETQPGSGHGPAPRAVTIE
jgi:peptidoglycan/LPS O-acetylase OafA/YrhL